MEQLKPYYGEIKNIVFSLGVLTWVLFLIVPMPPFIIDICISFSLGFSMIVLIQSSTIDTWENFKTFPLILLMATIFRIALGIATTRKIISGESPGMVIEYSGHFIVRDNLAVGFVMMIVLVIVGFLISNGAKRFGEVSARFSLDALPGKQLSIDNDLNQGVIDGETAKRLKKKLQQEVDYYGNLDGAGKYIQGDVWANVTLIVVNLIVGFIVGMVQLNLSLVESLQRFTMLTVGDGVITIICSLMTTVSGAIVMAKVDEQEENNLLKNESFLNKIFKELSSNGGPLFIVGFVLIVLGLLGLPFIPMFLIGMIFIVSGIVRQRNIKKELEEEKRRVQEQKEELTKEKEIEIEHEVDQITLEVGYKLAPLFRDGGKDIFGKKRENIRDKTILMRKIFANKYGVKLPGVRLRDNISLEPATKYVIKIKESVVASGVIEQGKALAIPTLLTLEEIEGIATKDPVNGQDALWIDENKIEEATDNAYDVWSPLNIIATHLHDVVEKNIWQFISLQETANMVEKVGEKHPILKEKINKIDDLHLLQKVIISLLKEKVSIKDLPTIFEAFLEAYSQTKEIDSIVSLVRIKISRQICENYLNKDGKLYMVAISNEDGIGVQNHNGTNVIHMDYDWQVGFINKFKKVKEDARMIDVEPVIVVNRPELRPALRNMLEMFQIETPVISFFEVPMHIDHKVINTI